MSIHPQPDVLTAFAVGRLETAQAEAVEQHLAACDECGQFVDKIDLSSDGLVGWLRDAATERGSGLPASEQQVAMPVAQGNGRFGQYVLQSEIGRGGMGVVYRAHDPRLRRDVALKIIAPHRSSQPEDRQRFRREAESAARLQHANIVQVFDFGEQDGTMYCAMEYVPGGDFAGRLEQAAVSQAEAAASLLRWPMPSNTRTAGK